MHTHDSGKWLFLSRRVRGRLLRSIGARLTAEKPGATSARTAAGWQTPCSPAPKQRGDFFNRDWLQKVSVCDTEPVPQPGGAKTVHGGWRLSGAFPSDLGRVLIERRLTGERCGRPALLPRLCCGPCGGCANVTADLVPPSVTHTPPLHLGVCRECGLSLGPPGARGVRVWVTCLHFSWSIVALDTRVLCSQSAWRRGLTPRDGRRVTDGSQPRRATQACAVGATQSLPDVLCRPGRLSDRGRGRKGRKTVWRGEAAHLRGGHLASVSPREATEGLDPGVETS